MCDFSEYGVPSENWLEVSSKAPTPQPNLSITESRTLANRQREKLAAEQMKPLAPLVRMRDHAIPTRDESNIVARSYRSVDSDTTQQLPVFMYFHGGGFLSGTIASEDAVCSRIAVNTKAVVLNVCYRHTPEYTYPTAWNDTHDSFEWLHSHIEDLGGDPQQVVLGGISAGAQLVASFVLQKHLGRLSVSRPPIAGQILMVPPLINIDCYRPMTQKFKDPTKFSINQNRNAPIVSMATFRVYTDLLKIDNPDENDLRLNPGYASSSQVAGFPPTVCAVAGLDLFRDEGLLYAKALVEAGVPTDVHMFPGLPHSFATVFPSLSESKRWNTVMDEGILWTLSKPTATGVFEIKTK
ncbi:hypothetical protein K449DRAFT_412375 [Hypoxylon sp. EC38]|nr:hypothetical protein K449DRAFT_412375 [Hypoxylon sp. EC38]